MSMYKKEKQTKKEKPNPEQTPVYIDCVGGYLLGQSTSKEAIAGPQEEPSCQELAARFEPLFQEAACWHDVFVSCDWEDVLSLYPHRQGSIHFVPAAIISIMLLSCSFI